MSKIAVNARVLGAPTTGVQRYTRQLLEHWPDDVGLVAPKSRMHGAKGHLWEQAVLPRLVGRRLLFSPSNTGPIAVRRQVLTVHDVAFLDLPETFSPQFAAWYRFLIPRLVRRVARVIAVSTFTRWRLIEHTGVDENRVVTIPNGVEDRFIPQSPEDIARVRKILGIPGGRYVLSLGSLAPRKNLHRLLRAWERILPYIPEDVWLILAGEKGDASVFRETSFGKYPDRVHFAGRIRDEELPALYGGALVFAFPSIYEGFGLPPLEAMAVGVPVLTGDRTALPEVVGDAGFLVDPYNVDELATGLKLLIDDEALRRELQKKGLERARHFSWEKTARMTWDVIQETLEENKR